MSTATTKDRGQAFLRLYLEHQDRIHALILSLLPNWSDADDVLQETAAVMWTKFDDYTPGTNFTAWAFRIARYQTLAHLKTKRRHAARLSDEAIDGLADQIEQASQHLDQRRNALAHCLAKLPPEDQALVAQRYQQGIRAADLAQDKDRSVSANYKSLNRIHEALLRCIRLHTTRQNAAPMPKQPHDARQLGQLLGHWREQTLSDAHIQQLDALLATNQAAQRHVAEHMLLCVHLKRHLSQTTLDPHAVPQAWAASSQVMQPVASAEVAQHQVAKTQAPSSVDTAQPDVPNAHPSRHWEKSFKPATAPTPASLSTNHRMPQRQTNRWAMWWAHGLLAATVGIVATAFWHVIAPMPGQMYQAPTGPPLPPPTVATLTQTVDAMWTHTDTAGNVLPEGQPFKRGDRLHLTHGYLSLQTPQGVSVTLQAPTQLVMADRQTLALLEGQLTARIQGPEGLGFAVNTPQGRIVDEGTEFGVRVDPNQGQTHTTVFEGRVALLPPNAQTPSQAAQAKPNQTKVLTAGQHGAIHTGQTWAIHDHPPADAPRFVRHTDTDPNRMAIHALAPLAHWSFEGQGASQLASAVNPHTHVGKALGEDPSFETTQGPQWQHNPVTGNQALLFDGKNFVDVGQVFGFENNEAFSLSLWIKPKPGTSGSLVSKMDLSAWSRGYDVYLDHERVLFQLKHQFLSDNLTDHTNALRIGTTQPLPLDQWMHVVATYDGSGSANGAKLYINGALQTVAILSDNLTQTIQNKAPFRIGRRLADTDGSLQQAHPSISPWILHGSPYEGEMDDVFVFDRVLSPSDIQTLLTHPDAFGKAQTSP